MEDNDRKEENNEVTRDMKYDETTGVQERNSDNRYQLISRLSSISHKLKQTDQYDKRLSRSRSRSRSKSARRRQRSSANAFLNFLQDFKQQKSDKIMKNKDLFRLGGKAWRQMSSAEKMPYVDAAKMAREEAQQKNKNGQQNNPNGSDSSKKSDNQKDQKKTENENSKKRSRSKVDDSDVESDSATSETDVTMTSEDVSDLSS